VMKYLFWALKTKNVVTPTRVAIPEKVNAIHSMILDHRRISANTTARTMVISQERVGCILHEISDMRKPSAKCVLTCLMAGQKRDRVRVSQVISDPFQSNHAGFFNSLITMVETCIHKYDTETKQ
jgi:hypothetical protein